MTGRYQQRWGKELNSQTVPPEGATRKSLPTSETSLEGALKAEGYAWFSTTADKQFESKF